MRRPLKSRLKDLRILLTLSRTATGDTALLTGILFGLNLLLAPDDIGLTLINPCPYLLVPIVIGCRYGMLAGLYSGLLITAIIGQGMISSDQPIEFRKPITLFILSAPPLVGLICGEMFSLISRNYLREKSRNRGLRRSLKAMDAEIRLLRFDTDENIRLGLLHQTGRIQLEADLKELLKLPVDRVPVAILSLLRHHLQVREAALYEVSRGNPLVRRANLLGSNRNLPAEIDTRKEPMLFQAIEIGRTTSLAPESPVDEMVSRQHLIAAPMRRENGDTFMLLVVADMPLTTFNRRAIRLVTLITDWAEECLGAHLPDDSGYRLLPEGRNRRIHHEASFRRAAEEHLRGHLRDTIPWQLCEIVRRNVSIPSEEFEIAIMGAARAEDIGHARPGEPYRMLVIMPLATANDAIRFENRIGRRLLVHGGHAAFEFIAHTNPHRDLIASLTGDRLPSEAPVAIEA